MDCKKYYPQELVYEMMIPGNLLKKVDELKAIHKMIDLAKDSGLLTRQEIVSMMPPALCDIQSHHSVLDMCAAPGSKTAQVLEMIMNDHSNILGKPNTELPKGFVVANDADHKRAYLLTHQINRFNTSNIAVTNHNAQDFPSHYDIATKERVMFDRILCDVPCSSDAAIRKLPNKWVTWGTKES